jgi:hypothetical protein
VIDGYSLSTHPDLCDRIKEINQAAGEPAAFRFLFGKPALIAARELVVAFGAGTHIFCVRLPRAMVEARLTVPSTDEPPHSPLLLAKQLQLEELLAHEWTRLDRWAVAVPKEEGLAELAALVARSVENAERWQTRRDS